METEFSICSVLFDVHLQDADHQNGQRAGEALDNLQTNMLNCGVTWSNPWGCVTDLWGGNCGPGRCLAPNRTWQERSLRAEEVLNATLDELAMCRWGNTSVGRNTTRRRRATARHHASHLAGARAEGGERSACAAHSELESCEREKDPQKFSCDRDRLVSSCGIGPLSAQVLKLAIASSIECR